MSLLDMRSLSYMYISSSGIVRFHCTHVYTMYVHGYYMSNAARGQHGVDYREVRKEDKDYFSYKLSHLYLRGGSSYIHK